MPEAVPDPRLLGLAAYLVGGAVRDRLLGLPASERDWVVVGSTPAEMEARGFRRLDHEFPVYAHPDSGEEYALARRERKIGTGHKGFRIDAGPEVTLEEDLHRRDFTINAIAQSPDGTLVDPWGGCADLKARRLRHVSPAFVEDPLRVLRCARFAARLAPLEFVTDPETLGLMRQMVHGGELSSLPAERVWRETERALREPEPSSYFNLLDRCGALAVLIPECAATEGAVGAVSHAGRRAITVLARAERASPDPVLRLAALMLGFARGLARDAAPADGVRTVRSICRRFRVPAMYRDPAVLAAEHLAAREPAGGESAEAVFARLEKMDAFRRPERLERLLDVWECTDPGCAGAARRLRDAHAAAAAVHSDGLMAQGFAGASLGRELRRLRIAAVHRALSASGG